MLDDGRKTEPQAGTLAPRVRRQRQHFQGFAFSVGLLRRSRQCFPPRKIKLHFTRRDVFRLLSAVTSVANFWPVLHGGSVRRHVIHGQNITRIGLDGGNSCDPNQSLTVRCSRQRFAKVTAFPPTNSRSYLPGNTRLVTSREVGISDTS
jgi:hypothetical protein